MENIQGIIRAHCKKCGVTERPRGAIFSCFHGNSIGYHGNMKILPPWGVPIHHIFYSAVSVCTNVLLLARQGQAVRDFSQPHTIANLASSHDYILIIVWVHHLPAQVRSALSTQPDIHSPHLGPAHYRKYNYYISMLR